MQHTPNHHLELFLDNRAISHERNVARRLQQPARHPDNPILQPEHPWESSFVTVYGSILACGDRLRMWYMAGAGGARSDQTMCLAESDDGINWQRVMNNTNPYGEATRTNIVLGPTPNIHGPCVIRNQHNDEPSQRYLALFDSYARYRPQHDQPFPGHSRNCYTTYSADGVTWHPPLGRPAVTGKSDVGQSVVRDPMRRRYIAYLRGVREPDPSQSQGSEQGRRLRFVRAAFSSDFEHWSEPIEAFRCDETDGDPQHQAHQLSVTYRHGQFIGLLSIFRIHSLIPMPQHNLMMEEGPIETQLITSRDGLRWDRVANRQIFFPRSADGEWDSYWFTSADKVVYDNDRMLIYYAANGMRRSDLPDYNLATPPGPSYRIGVATLPRDRFQSIEPDDASQPAILETKPLAFNDGDLQLNAQASQGCITVAACDFSGRPIEGFTHDDCIPMTADHLDHRLRWRSGGLTEARCAALGANHRMRLHFRIAGAQLFAAQWPSDTDGDNLYMF